MYRLTERRLMLAQPILEKHRGDLYNHQRFDCSTFEHQLRQCWNVGYQELKDIMQDLLKRERYRYVAAYYMEHSNAPVVVMEFQIPLAKEYGIRNYHGNDREDKRRAYWERFQAQAAAQKKGPDTLTRS
jgi:hypothetical protein